MNIEKDFKIITFEDKEEAAKSLASSLSDSIKKEGDAPVLLLLSGGSALSILYYISPEVFSEKLTISVLDERYDRTNKHSNFRQLSETNFFKKAKEGGCRFIDTSVKERQAQEELRDDFEKSLKDWATKNSKGKILATVGMGPDGHTSGIMPFPEDEDRFEDLFESEDWVVAYDALGKNEHAKRVTTTNTFLHQIDKAFVFISGVEKKEAFLSMQKEGILAEVPARILKEINAIIFRTNDLK